MSLHRPDSHWASRARASSLGLLCVAILVAAGCAEPAITPTDAARDPSVALDASGGGAESDGAASDGSSVFDASEPRDASEVFDAGDSGPDGGKTDDATTPEVSCDGGRCELPTCQTLSAPPHGSVDLPEKRTLGALARYACDRGYVLAGNAERTCAEDGNWTATEPKCERVKCSEPAAVANGTAAVLELDTGRYVAQYTCDSGYLSAGGGLLTCDENGTWQGEPPACTSVDCGAPAPVANGTVSAVSTTFGHAARQACNAGYTLVGDATRTCLAAGKWSGSVATCEPANCGVPPAPSAGSVSYPNGTTYGQIASFLCDAGYELIGSAKRSCQEDGTWSDSTPTCSPKDCGGLTGPAHGTVDTSNGTTFGKTVTYSCDSGYSLTAAATRTCQSNQAWSGSAPACTPVDCGAPEAVENGTVTAPNTTYGQSALQACNAGYTLVGDATRTCLATGKWSGSVEVCEPVNCGVPQTPSSGSVSYPNGTTYGQTASYSCNAGYELAGSATRSCQDSGTWSGTTPTCNPTDCGGLSNPADGTVVTSDGTTYGKTATYSCDSGYSLSGAQTRTCQADQTWSGSAPTCEPVSCGSLARPTDGRVSLTGTAFNSTATYSCNSGYTPSGPTQRTCQADGSWSGSAPTCVPVNCGALTSPTNGSVSTPGGTSFGATATYSCDANYSLAGANATRTCGASGQWNGTAVTCRRILYQEGFEGPSISGWTSGSGAYALSTVTAAVGSKSLSLTGKTDFQTALSHDFPADIKPTYISWRVRVPAPTTESATGYFIACPVAQWCNAVTAPLWVFFQSGGTITPSNTAYSGDQWYTFEVRNLNWATRSGSMYINGAAAGSVTIPSGTKVLRRLTLTTFLAADSDVTYWDEIIVVE